MKKAILFLILQVLLINLVRAQYLLEQMQGGTYSSNSGAGQIFKPKVNAKIKNITVYCKNKSSVNTFFRIHEGPTGNLVYSKDNVVLNSNSQATIVDLKDNLNQYITLDSTKKYSFSFCLNTTCTITGTGFCLDMEAGRGYSDGWATSGYRVIDFDSAISFNYCDLKFRMQFLPPIPKVQYKKNFINDTVSVLISNGHNVKWYLDESKNTYLGKTDTLELTNSLKNYHTFYATQTIDSIESELSKYDIPYADFSINPSICFNDSVKITFTGNSTDITNYYWDFDNANILSGSKKGPYIVKWNDYGAKEISLYLKDNGITLDKIVKKIIVNPIPTADFTVDANKICGNDTLLISYTGTGVANALYNWNFSGGNIVSGSGQGNYQINWLSPGVKTVGLSVVQNGCMSKLSLQSIKVYQPNSSFGLSDVVCENNNTNIFFTGIASDSAAFSWNFDGANVISGNKKGPYTVNWGNLGNKKVSLVINDNGCYSNQTIQTIAHNPVPRPTFTAPENVCFNGVAKIKYTGTASKTASYIWNFNNGSVLSGTGAGSYEIEWSNSGLKTVSLKVSENGCSSDTAINLKVNQQTLPISICMVSVDGSNHNMVVWESTLKNPYDSIVVYKETSQSDVYKKIGAKSATSTSVFIDNNSNPAQNSSRYKISVLDTCGYETSLSNYHKTMHLTINSAINGAWNLIWDGYEGFTYSTFYIYRGSSNNNLQKIAELASNTFTYSDLTPPVGTLYYQIEVVNPNSCNISNLKSSNNSYSSTRSNIVNSNQVTSINELSINDIKIYPNPAKDKLHIESNENIKRFDIQILSIDGKILMSEKNITLKTEIDISRLTDGIYWIRLSDDKKSINTKLIKM